MAFGAFNFNTQKQQSEQSSGLTPQYRSYFSSLAPGEYSNVKNLSNQAMGDPGGLQYQSVVDQLLPIGRYGLPTGATEGVHQLGRDLFTSSSGARANRGFNQPENLEGVLGDAVRMASGQLIPLSTQFAMQRAQMAPALRQAAFGYGTTPMQTLQNLLASSGSGTSSGSGMGFGVQGGYKV